MNTRIGEQVLATSYGTPGFGFISPALRDVKGIEKEKLKKKKNLNNQKVDDDEQTSFSFSLFFLVKILFHSSTPTIVECMPLKRTENKDVSFWFFDRLYCFRTLCYT